MASEQVAVAEGGQSGVASYGTAWARTTAGALAALQATACCIALQFSDMCVPEAKALLSSPNAQVARSVDAALRRSIPAFNPNVAKIQKTLEDIQYLLRIPQRKPWGSMSSNVASALAMATEQRQLLLEGVPVGSEEESSRLADTLLKRLQQLDLAVKTQQPDLTGLRVSESLKAVADLELLQAPGLSFIVPKEYAKLPKLAGRATVQLTVEKQDGSLAFVDSVNGGLTSRGLVNIVVNGYSAPVTAGNFIVNVLDGLYDGKVVQTGYTSVFVPGDLKAPRPQVPLEILPLGEFDPVYRVPLDVQNGELPVLPLSISGAISMAHVPDSESYLSGDEWFMFKFDKQQAGLSGLAFDEGTFGVFGYVTDGLDIMTKLKSGDMIVNAKVVSGAEKLVRP